MSKSKSTSGPERLKGLESCLLSPLAPREAPCRELGQAYPASLFTCRAEDQAVVVNDDDEILFILLDSECRSRKPHPKPGDPGCSLRSSLGAPGNGLCSPRAAGWESQCLGSALLEAQLSLQHLSPPSPSPTTIWGYGWQQRGVGIN